MIFYSDTQTICVHSSPFVLHRKQKIVVLIIIVFVGIVAVGIWFFGRGKPKDSTKASNRTGLHGGKHVVDVRVCDADGKSWEMNDLWYKVLTGLGNEPVSLTDTQRYNVMHRASNYYIQKYRDGDEGYDLNWEVFLDKIKKSCDYTQEVCILAESIIMGCETHTRCKRKMESVTDLLDDLMCEHCGSYAEQKCPQWPPETSTMDVAAPFKGSRIQNGLFS